MPPKVRQLTLASVSLITLYALSSNAPPSAAQDTPVATLPSVQPEVIVPAQPPTPDLSQQPVAELETQLAQRRQELVALQEQLRNATEELAALRQQQAELAQARETLSGQLAAMDQRVSVLERDLLLAREAEAAARALVSERDATAARLSDELNRV